MKPTVLQQKIYDIRGQKVMLDFDLAELYETETKRLKEAVRRNTTRFPIDFMFELTKDEWESLRTQFASSNRGGVRYLPFAFTEHGITMLASILNSERAIKMNIAIVRAFVALKEFAINYKDLADKLHLLETRYDKQFKDVYEALNYLIEQKQTDINFNKRKRIGFTK